MGKIISVIIPVYNIEHFLERCLKSVLGQTASNLEVIIVNDGSTDKTGEIADEYAKIDNRIKVIHKEHGGASSARVCGINIAKGTYIGFVDGDDYIDKTMYEELLNYMEQYDADIAHCGYRRVFPSGRVDYYYNLGTEILQDNETGLIDLLTGTFIEPSLGNKLFKRILFDSFIENDILLNDIKFNEDLLMNYYLFKAASRSIYVDFCPYCYRMRKNSASTGEMNKNKLLDPLIVTKTIIEDSKENYRVQDILKTKLVRQYINLATFGFGKEAKCFKYYKKYAREELKKLLPEMLKKKDVKLICMCFMAMHCPDAYGFIHAFYAKCKGYEKKYRPD